MSFSEPLDFAVFVTKSIMKNGEPVLFIAHYEDGDWQFSSNETSIAETDLMIVSLAEVIKVAPDVVQMAQLPKGFEASRLNETSPWQVFGLS